MFTFFAVGGCFPFSFSSSLSHPSPHHSHPPHPSHHPHTHHITMSSMLKKAAVVSIPTVRQALIRSNPVLANALLAKRSYNSKGGVEVCANSRTPLPFQPTLPLIHLHSRYAWRSRTCIHTTRQHLQRNKRSPRNNSCWNNRNTQESRTIALQTSTSFSRCPQAIWKHHGYGPWSIQHVRICFSRSSCSE